MRFEFIAMHRHIYPIGLMCEILKVSRSAYYSWFKREPSERDRRNKDLEYRIASIHKISRGTYGSPRIHAQLKNEGIAVSPNRVARAMQRLNLKAKTKRRFKTTTDSNHDLPIAPNLVKQNFKATRPNEIWGADITYLRTKEGWLYLAVIRDLFSRRIVGWSMKDHMRKELVLEALDMAIKSRDPESNTIHHSDRGSQYCSKVYRKKLAANGIKASMSRKGNCYDNAVVESFFHSMKTEHVYFSTLPN